MRARLKHDAALLAACLGLGAIATPAQSAELAASCPVTDTTDMISRAYPWRVVNDDVMGGRSLGDAGFVEGTIAFVGAINTNGGGFSSIRTAVPAGEMVGAIGVALRIKSDGQPYQITFRTTARYGWRPVSYQAVFPAAPKDEWAGIYIPFSALVPKVFGRRVQGGPFDPATVREVGVILSGVPDGPFQLELDQLRVCKDSRA
jgi:hypothetical protein